MTTQSHDHAHTPSKRSGVPIIAATLFATLALPTLTTTQAVAQNPPGGSAGQAQGAVPDILDRVRERDAQLDRLDRERRQAEENRRRANPQPAPPPQPAPALQPVPAAEKGFFEKVWDFFFGDEAEEDRQRREEFRRRIEEARRARDEERRRAEESQPQRQAEVEKPAQQAPQAAPSPLLPNATPAPAAPRAVNPRTTGLPPAPQGLRTMLRETRHRIATGHRAHRSRQVAIARHAPVRMHGPRHTLARRTLTAAQLNAMEAARYGRSAYAAERQREVATTVLSTGLGIALGVGMGRMGGGHHRTGGHHRMGGGRMMGMGGRMGRF